MRNPHLADGDGDTGFTRYMTASEFKQYNKINDREHKRINLALWGDEGTTGLVKTVNGLSLEIKILIGILTFIQPLIFAAILRWFGV